MVVFQPIRTFASSSPIHWTDVYWSNHFLNSLRSALPNWQGRKLCWLRIARLKLRFMSPQCPVQIEPKDLRRLFLDRGTGEIELSGRWIIQILQARYIENWQPSASIDRTLTDHLLCGNCEDVEMLKDWLDSRLTNELDGN